MWSFPNRNQWKIPLAGLLWVAASHPASGATVGFRTRELPWAAFGSAYRVVLGAFVDGRCIDGGVTFSLVDGALPSGMELRGETISGTPEEFGAFSLRLRAGNGCGYEERDFVLQVTGRPILQISPEEIDLEYRSGGPAPEKILLVSASWPRLAYSLTNGSSPWLRVRQQAGVTPLPGSAFGGDVVRLQIVTENLAPGSYETALVFSGPNGAAAVSVPVRLRVIAAPALTSTAAEQR